MNDLAPNPKHLERLRSLLFAQDDASTYVRQISQGYGRCAVADGGGHQIIDAHNAVRQRKLGMHMQMNKRDCHDWYFTAIPE